MNQDRVSEINELETKFQQFLEMGHPNVVDNGFFIDAIFNVTSKLKESYAAKGEESSHVYNVDESVEKLYTLYNSLKDFERLYSYYLSEKE